MNEQETRDLIMHGTYYNPATLHYQDSDPSKIIMCDRCYTPGIECCVGYGLFDMCLMCVSTVTSKIGIDSLFPDTDLSVPQQTQKPRKISIVIPPQTPKPQTILPSTVAPSTTLPSTTLPSTTVYACDSDSDDLMSEMMQGQFSLGSCEDY